MNIQAETGITRILRERTRQMQEEGYTAAHDDAHACCELRKAAECYATAPALRHYRRTSMLVRDLGEPQSIRSVPVRVPKSWPWEPRWWKPSTRKDGVEGRVRELEKAGALYMAESDRQLRCGHGPTAGRMLAKAYACGRQIDRLLIQSKR